MSPHDGNHMAEGGGNKGHVWQAVGTEKWMETDPAAILYRTRWRFRNRQVGLTPHFPYWEAAGRAAFR